MTETTRKHNESDLADPANYWNAWTTNYRASTDGYITHAIFLGGRARTLCGCKWQESGWLNLGQNEGARGDVAGDWWEPGCVKCWLILEKRGLIEKAGGSRIWPNGRRRPIKPKHHDHGNPAR